MKIRKKIISTLENIAEKGVTFLDRNLYHLSAQDLDAQIPLSDDNNFNRLERERMFYSFQGLAGAVGGIGCWITGIVFAARAAVYAGKWLGYGMEGAEVIAHEAYVNSMVCIGAGIVNFWASPLFAKFGEKTLDRYKVLKKKTDDYANTHGLKTATVK